MRILELSFGAFFFKHTFAPCIGHVFNFHHPATQLFGKQRKVINNEGEQTITVVSEEDEECTEAISKLEQCPDPTSTLEQGIFW